MPQMVGGTRRLDIECSQILVLMHRDRPTHGQANLLHHVLANGNNRIACWIKQFARGLGAIDFLERNHIGREFLGISMQRHKIGGHTRLHVRRQRSVMRRPQREPIDVPRSNFVFRAARGRRG
jgi:hypothetical protein